MSPEEQHRQARRLWTAAEAIHAVTYFHPVCHKAMADAGARGFWMAYFVARMAPLGAVEAVVAEAVAFGFSPERPARALPDGWRFVPPEAALLLRTSAAAEALMVSGTGWASPETLETLAILRHDGRRGGHPLGAANQVLPLVEEEPARLWQLVTWLREQRGDDHVALWVGEGFDGCEANVLTTAIHHQDPDTLRLPRAWSMEEWSDAGDRLASRGILDVVSDGAATPTVLGKALHSSIESRTDAVCSAQYRGSVGEDQLEALVRELEELARPVVSSGVYPFPNPMGLQPPARGR